ncbi:MAG: hypothetical protein R3212_01000 [Xanthomonadales bacterium]|nr:hypothetical protein [Xanthomonadales bacterium]
MIRFPANILAALLVGLTVSAQAWSQEGGEASISPDATWRDVSAVRMDVEFPGDGYHASWLLHRCECGDLLIESELNLPGEVEKGELLLVGQRAVLERGFKSEELETEMSWDAPALMLQLAGYLLERSVPAGPASVTQNTVVSFAEATQAINLDSGNAVGGFPAPWEVTATVAPQGETHRRFDLRFSFAVPGQSVVAEMRLKGVGDYARRNFPLPDDMPLKGWKLSWRDANDQAAASGKARDLSELRALIASTPRQADP